MLLDISPAGLSQGGVIAVVVDLHLDEVEDLILTGSRGQLILVIGEAAQHLAPAGTVHCALVSAEPIDIHLACLVQPEIQPALTSLLSC